MRRFRAEFLAMAAIAAIIGLAGCEGRANIRGDKSVVMLLDDQADFLRADGRDPVAQNQVPGLIQSTNAIIAAAAQNDVPVTYVRDEFSPFDLVNYFERHGATPRLWAGSQLDPSINEWAGPYFTKTQNDAFRNPKLQGWLAMQQAGKLIIGGVFADGSVLATARGAIQRGFHVVVISDAIAAASDQDRDTALKALADAGAHIQSSQEFIASIGSSGASPQLPQPEIEYTNPKGLPGNG
jgi:nicotinamidase-related amidase